MNTKQKPIAWSWSAINSFQTCGKQYYEVKVLKKYKDDNVHNRWGDEVHAYFAKQLLKPEPANPSMAMYDGVIHKLRQIEGQLLTEQKYAITNSFKPTTWFGSDVWCRGIADALWLNGEIAKTIDIKTGRQKPDSKQLLLMALLLFAHYPDVQKVNTAFVWLQTGKMDVEKYKREDVSLLWQEILPDVRRFEMAHAKQEWTPKPSGLCRNYCPVVDCHFNGRFEEHGVAI